METKARKPEVMQDQRRPSEVAQGRLRSGAVDHQERQGASSWGRAQHVAFVGSGGNMGEHVRESAWEAWMVEVRRHWAVEDKYQAEAAYKPLEEGAFGALETHTYVVHLEEAFQEGKVWPA